MSRALFVLVLTARVEILDATGKSAYAFSPNDGATATATIMGAPAGTYRIVVRPFIVQASNVLGRLRSPLELPENFTRPYRLIIRQ